MRKKLISALQRRARIVVRASHARPRGPHRTQRLSRFLLGTMLSILISTSINIYVNVDLSNPGLHKVGKVV